MSGGPILGTIETKSWPTRIVDTDSIDHLLFIVKNKDYSSGGRQGYSHGKNCRLDQVIFRD